MQRSIISEYCAQHNHIIVAWYIDEAVSGGIPIAERPQARKMLQDAKTNQIEGIITKQADRLGRNPGDTISFAGICKKRKLSLIFCQESYADTPAGRMHFGLMAVIAGYYREDIGQKIKDHNIMCAKTGRWTSGYPPMGYTYDRTTKTLTPDPERIPHVERLFEIFIKNSGSRTLTAFQLNSEGIPAPRSPLWTHSQVSRTIRNSLYRGLQQYDDIEYPFTVEPIIAPGIVDQAYQLFLSTKGLRQSTTFKAFPYNKILYCGQCGDRMYGEVNPKKTPFYRCSNRHYKGVCGAKSISESRLDRALVPILGGLLRKESNHIESRRKHQESQGSNKKEGNTKQSHKGLEAQRERLIDTYISGILNKEDFEKKLARIDEKLKLSKVEEPKQSRIPPEILKDLSIHIEKHWSSFTDAEKRQILTLLIPQLHVISTGPNEPLQLIINSPLLDEPLKIN